MTWNREIGVTHKNGFYDANKQYVWPNTLRDAVLSGKLFGWKDLATMKQDSKSWKRAARE